MHWTWEGCEGGSAGVVRGWKYKPCGSEGFGWLKEWVVCRSVRNTTWGGVRSVWDECGRCGSGLEVGWYGLYVRFVGRMMPVVIRWNAGLCDVPGAEFLWGCKTGEAGGSREERRSKLGIVNVRLNNGFNTAWSDMVDARHSSGEKFGYF
ncbi:hypothetical protein IAQ61_001082 [Plenodomus lingam]|uniref:uncharacterized protein n=1 Tax=Leptosphaeria maculans TaxID=5022 RepID=UPI003319E00C|nr:hypothetical protein IAQ61_001082 [Plenodomus lingam]